MAAACIALIAFFTISTPLGSPTIEKSQIDTGMLTRIMPKEMTPVKSNELLLPTDEPKLMETTPTDKAEKLRQWHRIEKLLLQQPLITASYWQAA